MLVWLMSIFPVCLSGVDFQEELAVLRGDVDATLQSRTVNKLRAGHSGEFCPVPAPSSGTAGPSACSPGFRSRVRLGTWDQLGSAQGRGASASAGCTGQIPAPGKCFAGLQGADLLEFG